MQTGRPVLWPAPLALAQLLPHVLPHLLPHLPFMDLRAPCLLPLRPTKALQPWCLHLPRRLHRNMKSSLKENDIFEPSVLLKPGQHSYAEGGLSKLFCPPCRETPKHLTPWDLAPLAQSLAGFPYGDDSVSGLAMFKWSEEKNFSPAWLTHVDGVQSFLFTPFVQLISFITHEDFSCWRGCHLEPALLKLVFVICYWLLPSLFSAFVSQLRKRNVQAKWLLLTDY